MKRVILVNVLVGGMDLGKYEQVEVEDKFSEGNQIGTDQSGTSNFSNEHEQKDLRKLATKNWNYLQWLVASKFPNGGK